MYGDILKIRNSFVLVIFTFIYFFIDFNGYYIVRTDEGQPRPKYIFNKCGTYIYFFTLQRFGPSPSQNFNFNSFTSINVRTLTLHNLHLALSIFMLFPQLREIKIQCILFQSQLLGERRKVKKASINLLKKIINVFWVSLILFS